MERNGYTKDLEVIPQPEGPARLAKAMRQLYGGLAALGVDDELRWNILTRIALDCAPAVRMPLIRALLDHTEDEDEWLRTAAIGETVGMVTKTAAVHLDDLTLIGLAERMKESNAANAAHLWRASPWLREHWPLKVGTKTTTTHTGTNKEGSSCTDSASVRDGTFRSRALQPSAAAFGGEGALTARVSPLCTVCREHELIQDESITRGVCAECALITYPDPDDPWLEGTA